MNVNLLFPFWRLKGVTGFHKDFFSNAMVQFTLYKTLQIQSNIVGLKSASLWYKRYLDRSSIRNFQSSEGRKVVDVLRACIQLTLTARLTRKGWTC